MKKIVIVLLLIVVVGGGICLYVCSHNSEDNSVVKIGAILDLSGPGSNYGISLQRGMEIAKDEINEKGGINGRMISLVYEDSHSDASIGVSAFNKLVSTDNVQVVFGSISSVILAVQPVSDKKGVVLINSSAISPKICENATDYLFSIMVKGGDEAEFMAEDFQNMHKNEKIAVLYSNNSSGVDTKDKFVNLLLSLGNKNVREYGYELGTTDFRISLNKIKKTGAKYGYLIAFSSDEFANILKQTKEVGLDIQWYSYSGIETSETLDLARGAADGVIYSYPKYTEEGMYDVFQEKFERRYKTVADIYTVTSYDGLHLLANVMNQYGTTANNIQEGLRHSEYDGVFGKIEFSRDKQCAEYDLFWKSIKNGKYVSIRREQYGKERNSNL